MAINSIRMIFRIINDSIANLEIIFMKRHIKATGFIISSKTMFEHDKLLVVLTPTLGKCNVLVKNAKLQNARYGGNLDALNHIEMDLFQGTSFLLMDQCELIKPYIGIRADFNKLRLAFHCFDLVNRAAHFEQPIAPLVALIQETLDRIENETNLNGVRDFFYKEFLVREGLISATQSIHFDQFKPIYEEYTGCLIDPVLIH